MKDDLGWLITHMREVENEMLDTFWHDMGIFHDKVGTPIKEGDKIKHIELGNTTVVTCVDDTLYLGFVKLREFDLKLLLVI